MTTETIEPTATPQPQEVIAEDLPALEAVGNQASEAAGASNKKQNRNEKKVRKLLSKTGVTQVNGIFKASVKSSGNQVSFSVHNPEVFTSPSGQIYLIFGEPKVYATGSSSTLRSAAEQLVGDEEAPALVPEEDNVPLETVEINDSDLPEKDIELVVSQSSCTKAQAIKALKENKGDVVASIMSLIISS